ncbi:hypothetical protein BLNAU_6859 [Blattamonas nauphoetae]|uniref:Uncharacterized protein n=1 Tax=Blattamonas nauphoetae TaxID=2049346 RepID=A0ABQ9Y341_9EUKA|nr:hypothetical protein BLNAU_6859 [Blattamonas nauphoetae]
MNEGRPSVFQEALLVLSELQRELERRDGTDETITEFSSAFEIFQSDLVCMILCIVDSIEQERVNEGIRNGKRGNHEHEINFYQPRSESSLEDGFLPDFHDLTGDSRSDDTCKTNTISSQDWTRKRRVLRRSGLKPRRKRPLPPIERTTTSSNPEILLSPSSPLSSPSDSGFLVTPPEPVDDAHIERPTLTNVRVGREVENTMELSSMNSSLFSLSLTPTFDDSATSTHNDLDACSAPDISPLAGCSKRKRGLRFEGVVLRAYSECNTPPSTRKPPRPRTEKKRRAEEDWIDSDDSLLNAFTGRRKVSHKQKVDKRTECSRKSEKVERKKEKSIGKTETEGEKDDTRNVSIRLPLTRKHSRPMRTAKSMNVGHSSMDTPVSKGKDIKSKSLSENVIRKRDWKPNTSPTDRSPRDLSISLPQPSSTSLCLLSPVSDSDSDSSSPFRTPNVLGDAPTGAEVSEMRLQTNSASLTLTYDNAEDIAAENTLTLTFTPAGVSPTPFDVTYTVPSHHDESAKSLKIRITRIGEINKFQWDVTYTLSNYVNAAKNATGVATELTIEFVKPPPNLGIDFKPKSKTQYTAKFTNYLVVREAVELPVVFTSGQLTTTIQVTFTADSNTFTTDIDIVGEPEDGKLVKETTYAITCEGWLCDVDTFTPADATFMTGFSKLRRAYENKADGTADEITLTLENVLFQYSLQHDTTKHLTLPH